ncbi:MAG: ATP-binding protein [Chlamydiae bacterium]|nr:ATP-binding protein [Chlamydiota bacterium]
MERDIEKDLLQWKDSAIRAPLLLRGARQVGKSFIIEKFGKEKFTNYVTINFEQTPQAGLCFDTLFPNKIVAAIELFIGAAIRAGETLLFLDEIQECPAAITSLRYFKEQMPELHIIGAGSLLEFVLNEESISIPVGRIQFLYLRPMSFGEFLVAIGRTDLRNYLKTVALHNTPPQIIHEELLKLIKEYASLGGMPAVISAYLQTKSLYQTQDVQSDILTTYRRDFGKYAKKTKHKCLQLLFEKAPGLIGTWFKYVNVDPDIPSRDVKVAVEQLCFAGLLYQVFYTTASGLPLSSTQKERKFKIIFLDIGLVKKACGLDTAILFTEDLMLINQGKLTEQFVGQELLAYLERKEAGNLFFWNREENRSSAEIDFVVSLNGEIIPIEVKSGTTGRLKSLKTFMLEKHSRIGVRISASPLACEEQILSVPFYLISELSRLLRTSFTE